MDQSERDRSSVRLCWGAALIAITLGMWFRISGLSSTPLWLDESYSAFAADHEISYIWSVVPKYDVHPPLYYSILHFWDLIFGNTLFERRLLGLLCGSATIAVAAGCGATLGGLIGEGRAGRARIATLAAILVALQPMMIVMTQQVRPYPVMILTYTVGVLAILKISRADRTDGGEWGNWAVLAFIVEALMLWLHSLGPFYAAALSIALFIALLRNKPSPTQWLFLFAGQAMVAAVYLPAALILTDQAPTWIHSSWLLFYPSKVLVDLATIYFSPEFLVAIGGVVASGIGASVLIRRKASSVATALLVLGILPTALALSTSLILAPVFLPRTLSPATIPILILISGALAIEARWRQVIMALSLIMILPFAWADYQTTRSPPNEDWGGTVAWLSAHVKPGDVVWAYPNDSALPLRYAMHDMHQGFPVRQIPTDVPALGYPGTHPDGGRGTVALSAPQIDALMQTDAAQAPRTIWLLGLASSDLMEKALSHNRIPIERFSRDEITVVGLARRLH